MSWLLPHFACSVLVGMLLRGPLVTLVPAVGWPVLYLGEQAVSWDARAPDELWAQLMLVLTAATTLGAALGVAVGRLTFGSPRSGRAPRSV